MFEFELCLPEVKERLIEPFCTALRDAAPPTSFVLTPASNQVSVPQADAVRHDRRGLLPLKVLATAAKETKGKRRVRTGARMMPKAQDQRALPLRKQHSLQFFGQCAIFVVVYRRLMPARAHCRTLLCGQGLEGQNRVGKRCGIFSVNP